MRSSKVFFAAAHRLHPVVVKNSIKTGTFIAAVRFSQVRLRSPRLRQAITWSLLQVKNLFQSFQSKNEKALDLELTPGSMMIS